MTTHTSPARAANQRDLGIDLLRALCILYVVGYWHLIPYTTALPGYANSVTEAFKYAALATFVFCSGWLLARQSIQLHIGELWSFYQKRLLRIYPLYALTLILFGLFGLATLEQVTDGLLLISMLSPPAMPTLWFITMIMLFYLIAPLLIHAAPQLGKTAFISAVIALLIISYHFVINPIDWRLLLYFPVFVLGILYRQHPLIAQWLRQKPAALLGAVLFMTWSLSLVGYEPSLVGVLFRWPLVITSALILFLIADPIARHLHTPTINLFAYSSFGLYLCHRLIFKGAIAVYYPDNGWAQVGYLLAVALPLSVFIGYVMQRRYDALFAR
ncbi:acyltransferase family protein [Thiospirillum jenense]|uniref:Acyltransferase n=1 Tax=Thiospirillum jenense TaxID=1653858 RepID=A0A839HM77_9GAMM|nr:acyltransferase family protein [Thiospirillum jenense]MBB1127339.1 acyltransferase [Thiospirillum jenense]